MSFAVEACDVACRTRWDRVVTLPPGPVAPPFVSVHVAAYNEPPEMLIETIRSLEALDYPAYEIVVVDNNTPDVEVWGPVQEYCAGRPGVRFVHVDPWPGYKAGALNLALAAHTDPRAEVIAVVDADYLVDPRWLTDLTPWFANPTVAFVQCPQDYDEWDGDTYLTACRDSYAYFFAASMRFRNERNSAIFGGTMGLVRRSALVEVGGWDEWCITEDAEASLRLYAAGYQGVYVHESYGRGIMPLTFDALKRQRFRWCFGGMQLLRRHARLLLPGRRGDDDALSPAQRLDFLVGGLQWTTDLVALASAVVLVGTAITLAGGGAVGFRPLGGPALALPLVLAVTGGIRAVWGLRVLERDAAPGGPGAGRVDGPVAHRGAGRRARARAAQRGVPADAQVAPRRRARRGPARHPGRDGGGGGPAGRRRAGGGVRGAAPRCARRVAGGRPRRRPAHGLAQPARRPERPAAPPPAQRGAARAPGALRGEARPRGDRGGRGRVRGGRGPPGALPGRRHPGRPARALGERRRPARQHGRGPGLAGLPDDPSSGDTPGAPAVALPGDGPDGGAGGDTTDAAPTTTAPPATQAPDPTTTTPTTAQATPAVTVPGGATRPTTPERPSPGGGPPTSHPGGR